MTKDLISTDDTSPSLSRMCEFHHNQNPLRSVFLLMNRKMRLSIFWVISLFLFVGCHRHSVATRNSPPREILISSFGEYSGNGGAFKVKISQPGGKLEIIRQKHLDTLSVTNPVTREKMVIGSNLSISNTYSPGGWKAQSGWFVFVKDDSQIWAYDGDQFLWLQVIDDAAGDSGSYDPTSFPTPVPKKVLERLPESLKKRIEFRLSEAHKPTAEPMSVKPVSMQ